MNGPGKNVKRKKRRQYTENEVKESRANLIKHLSWNALRHIEMAWHSKQIFENTFFHLRWHWNNCSVNDSGTGTTNFSHKIPWMIFQSDAFTLEFISISWRGTLFANTLRDNTEPIESAHQPKFLASFIFAPVRALNLNTSAFNYDSVHHLDGSFVCGGYVLVVVLVVILIVVDVCVRMMMNEWFLFYWFWFIIIQLFIVPLISCRLLVFIFYFLFGIFEGKKYAKAKKKH